MKNNVVQRLPLFLVIVLLLASCSQSSEKSEQEKERLRLAKINAEVALLIKERDFILEFENFKNETQLKVEKNNQFISELKSKIIEEKKSSSSDFAAEIRLFENRNKDLKKRVEAFDNSRRSDWLKFKAEVNQDFEDLGNAISDFIKTPENER
ncbi:hypothetical protein [Mongoliitalea daihaiensis]|uniref:hypothetical protein n=1 Tax=Mongoliitalea daihaiensis TaxID=2782006 RepID=UPI001F2BBF22|nr:hypothetical protein [Mongoliitalea daihaiensis]UJP64718.1 hypothetical protein IPZ59_18260 [Mongoliitalea daihaiensis]